MLMRVMSPQSNNDPKAAEAQAPQPPQQAGHSSPTDASITKPPYTSSSYIASTNTSKSMGDSTTVVSGTSTATSSLMMSSDEESWEFTIATQIGFHNLKRGSRTSSGVTSGGGIGSSTPSKEQQHQQRAGSLRGSLRGSTRKSSKSKRLSEYTLDKLQFGKLGHLYGRDKETSDLLQAWRDVSSSSAPTNTDPSSTSTVEASADEGSDKRDGETLSSVTPTPPRRRFVTVSGASGTGKSALAESIKPKVIRTGGFFLQGKFPQQLVVSRGGLSARHQSSAVEPYAAFSAACHELCDLMVSLDDDGSQNASWYQERTAKYKKHYKFTLAQLKEKFEVELGKDASVLVKVIPGLQQILPHHQSDDNNGDGNNSNDATSSFGEESIGYREAQHQFKFAFRKFLRIVSSFSPMVLVLDDLQWADVASMELLEALLTDRESSSGLLVIGSYRDYECYADMPHHVTLASIANHATQDSALQVDSIPIGNLNVSQVNDLLVDLLSANSANETLGLAECVYKKTLGNIFFVIQFLTLLQDSELLAYNFGIMKWKWDLKEIQLQTAATDNVVEMMNAKMQGLPATVGKALPIMACLGSTFSTAVFELVASHFTWDDDDDEDDEEGDEDCGGHNDQAPSNTTLSDDNGADDDNVASAKSQKDPSTSPDEQSPEQAISLAHRSHPQPTELLQFCEDQGLIELAGDTDGSGYSSYQWVHDKIQEAACTLLNDDDLNALKLQLGKILFEGFEDAMLEKNLFIVANLLNTDSSDPLSLPRQNPLAVAKLFLRAGVKTIQNSAFDQAAGYLLAGIRLLPPNHWQDHYELSLDLYSTAAEAEFCTGNFDCMTEYCNEVIKQEKRPLLDKRRVYNVMIDSTGAAGGQPAALALCRDILSKLGYKFPNHAVMLHVLAGIVQIKSTLKKTTSHELMAKLPAMEDPNKQWATALLDKFITYAYMLKSDLLPLAIFKGMKLTMKEGVYFYSPVMFALVGLSLSAFVNDYKGGLAFGDQAVEMLKQVKSSRKVHARVYFIVHCFVFNWLRPITLSIKPLIGGYEIGMAMGDTESAAWCIYFSLEYSFRTGTPLETMIADCAFYSEQLREVKQLKIHAVLLNLWQTSLLLTGENDFDGTLTGDIVQQEKALSEAGGFEAYLFVAINRVLMYVAFVLGEHKIVYESIKKTEMDNGGYEKVFPGIAGIYHLYAFNGLSMISLYRETKEKKYLKLAKKFAAKIKGWAVADNPNVSHYDALLEAELESLKGDHYKASKSYEVAILYAGRRGLTQDRALAHELYGEYLDRLGDERAQDAEFQIGEAIKLYQEWGAYAKVRLVHKRHEKLVSPPSEIEIETYDSG